MNIPRCSVAWLAIMPFSLLASCSATAARPDRSAALKRIQPEIELLGFPDCPNTPALREGLAAALAAIGDDWTFTDTDQEQLPLDDPRRGYPAPTILVNGRDIENHPPPSGSWIGCRVYPDGAPDASYIEQRIRTMTAHRTP
ncbi:MAG: hypothetical protein JNK25_15325 [Phycisphaerae bacterium]|nr:hypothetical protein [Phycisphaerae bacterium]